MEKLNIKQISLIVWAIGTIALVFLCSYLYLGMVVKSTYDRGFSDGKAGIEVVFQAGIQEGIARVDKSIIQQLSNTGELKLTVPQEDGSTKTIILIEK